MAKMEALAIQLNRDQFLQGLLRHLSGALQDAVGLEEAEGFISYVGQQIGEELNQTYLNNLQVDKLSRAQVSAVLVDLKQRIQGDFYIISESDEKIVLGNRRCPFGDRVLDRPSLCMMTSNVFGVITAENLGYAHISIDKAIARHDPECQVTVHLSPGSSESGLEYFSE